MLDHETLRDFRNKEYAHEYMDEFLNTFIATQIKILREQNEWTQERLAKEADMFQERISTLENVNNSSLSLKTLKQLARAFDVRLHVSFENFTTELEQFDEFTLESIRGKKSLERMRREQDLSLAEKRLEEKEKVPTSAMDDLQSLALIQNVEKKTGEPNLSGLAPEGGPMKAFSKVSAVKALGGFVAAITSSATQSIMGRKLVEAANQR